MRRFLCFSVVLALALLALGPNIGWTKAAKAKQSPIKIRPEYRIGPSDIIEIIVWREASLSRSEVPVRPDGRISLPLTNDVQAAGKTPMQLKYALTRIYKKFVQAPQVYVMIRQPRSHVFSVLGNVLKPGEYPMFTPTTVLQALARAGGFNQWASKDKVKIIRGEGKEAKIYRFEYSDVVQGEKLEQNILLKPGDVILVP